MDTLRRRLSLRKRFSRRSRVLEDGKGKEGESELELEAVVKVQAPTAMDDRTWCSVCRQMMEFLTATRWTDDTVFSRLWFPKEPFAGSYCQPCRSFCNMTGSLRFNESRWCNFRSIHDLIPNISESKHSKSSPLLSLQGKRAEFGFLHSNLADKDIKPRRIEPLGIDSSVIRGWMRFCDQHHQVTCQPISGELVHGFKLIDCQTRCIIQPGQSCKYVALSYVWGALKPYNHALGTFPRTIEDSITITLELGFRYLWVDKYVWFRVRTVQ